MSTLSPHLSPTIYRPSGADLPVVAPRAIALADAPPVDPAFGDDDFISSASLTFRCLPLGGATAARGFEPFALP